MINDYVARKVAMKDMQPCMVCGKPSTTVLYNASGPDWFYTCDIHLKDNPQFASPIYSKEYEKALNKMKSLKLDIDNLSPSKSGSWDTWVSSIFVRPKKKNDEPERSNEAMVDIPDKNQTTETNSPDKRNDLQKLYQEQVDFVTSCQNKNKRYQLSKLVFESRISRKRQQERLIEKRKLEQETYTNTNPDELLQKFSFPSVPKK